MDIHSVRIRQEDIDRILAEATPAEPVGLIEDSCSIYHRSRSTIMIAISILGFVYPPGAAALAAVVAILDKACEPASTTG